MIVLPLCEWDNLSVLKSQHWLTGMWRTSPDVTRLLILFQYHIPTLALHNAFKWNVPRLCTLVIVRLGLLLLLLTSTLNKP